MKHNLLNVLSIVTILCTILTGCDPEDKPFEQQEKLDSLVNGTLDFGDPSINDAMIRKLTYQKIKKTGKSNGVVIPKELLTISVNGFSDNLPNLPVDTNNYAKWDFMVVYPGIIEDEQGNQKNEPVIFFYKGSNVEGSFIPSGNPVPDISFPGGGGGPGGGAYSTPPPN